MVPIVRCLFDIIFGACLINKYVLQLIFACIYGDAAPAIGTCAQAKQDELLAELLTARAASELSTANHPPSAPPPAHAPPRPARPHFPPPLQTPASCCCTPLISARAARAGSPPPRAPASTEPGTRNESARPRIPGSDPAISSRLRLRPDSRAAPRAGRRRHPPPCLSSPRTSYERPPARPSPPAPHRSCARPHMCLQTRLLPASLSRPTPGGGVMACGLHGALDRSSARARAAHYSTLHTNAGATAGMHAWPRYHDRRAVRRSPLLLVIGMASDDRTQHT